MTGISTHILDTACGHPANQVSVILYRQVENSWVEAGQGITNDDGRINSLTTDEVNLPKGVYKLDFAIQNYFRRQQQKCFYPAVSVIFEVSDDRHHHIPLLISPFGYSTYRGS
ncbi:hydroxyisourate hydrolase [Endozoicomonas numazuensis]|uniref:5-hydroxyisourate hydrolase n=1 Tax=Endozoicomonas numazuensis TaxID=1137799 RepID=A0A081NEB4_9GAMM|nr:hydroxyisourate hydrolase [Endozoicomonas numazuensis]KEQ16787.1 5-hydroxyisourate hydrolase [Endozoicomonas numazuensis]